MRRPILLLAMLAATAAASDWPQFLGPDRNGAYPGPSTSFSLHNPRLLWKQEVGAGFSSPTVAGERLILFHRKGGNEIVAALDAASGKRIWSFEYPTAYRDDFGFDEGPRGTPAIAGGRVYTYGAEGMLHALDLATGKKLWGIDTHSRFKVRKGFFGAAASPLVEGNAVVVNVGGPEGSGLVAFEAATGKVLWTATNDEAGYSSPIAATIEGRRSILCLTRAGLVAVDPAAGSVRFQFPWRARSHASVNAAVPIVAGNLIFLSASYNTGATLLEAAGDRLKQLWSSDEALSSHYASSVLKDGYLYGFHGRQEFGQSFRCIEMKTGKVRWSVDGIGAGTVTRIGDRLLIVKENGEGITAAASPEAFKPESQAQLLPRVVRSYPALANGRLFVRNETTLAAYSIEGAK